MSTRHRRRDTVSAAPSTIPTPRTAPPGAVGLGAALLLVVGLGAPLLPPRFGLAGIPDPASVDPGAVVSGAVVSGAVGAEATPTAIAAPSEGELYPVGITETQQRFVPTAEQLANARAIVDAGKAMGLAPRAWVIAVGTALQESGLRNLGHLGARNDHDSLGLFQQRPSAGWGTPEQVTDPAYAATAFYNRLCRVRDWSTLPLTVAAQKVQVSAFPNHYAKHESEAGDIIRGIYGEGPYAGLG